MLNTSIIDCTHSMHEHIRWDDFKRKSSKKKIMNNFNKHLFIFFHSSVDHLKAFMLAEPNPAWHALGLLLVILLFIIRRWASRTNIIMVFLSGWPGVVLHELCHLIIGLLFNARPSRLSLIPERNDREGSWTLGSVEFRRITALNAVPIALAPLLLVVFAYCLFRYWRYFFPLQSMLNTLGLYGVMFVLVYNSVPSRQDIRVACNWRSLLLYGAICFALLLAFKYL